MMGVTNQEMPTSHFDEEIKKPGLKSRKLNKKFLGFLAFAVIILQVADSFVLWLIGSSKSSQLTGSGLQGDIFMFSAVIFCILNGIYTKFFLKKSKVCDAEESSAESLPEEVQQSATIVVDTMKMKGPEELFPRSEKKKKRIVKDLAPWVSLHSESSHLSDYNPDLAMLNAKAKKFVPLVQNGTLDSAAPVFMPHAHAQKEEELLKSQYGDKHVGSVVYRSSHWLKEICPYTEKPDTKVSRKKSNSPEHVKLEKAQRKPKAAQRWVPKQEIVWASRWSNLKDCLSLAA